jgi:hypothetical protein
MAGKEFGATVPETEWQRFKQNTGMIYGATNWFINTALKEFNDRVEANPTLKVMVSQSIESMLVERREEKQG